VLTGLILVAVGTVIKTRYRSYIDFTGSAILAAPVLLIVVGVVVFLVAFIGCWGAIRENYWLLILYGCILILVLTLEMGTGIAGYVLRKTLRRDIIENASSTMSFYARHSNRGKSATEVWDHVQHKLTCCGIFTPKDWLLNNEQFNATYSVPDSCCKNARTTGCGYGVLSPNSTKHQKASIYSLGCVEDLIMEIEGHIIITVAVGFCFALMQVLGICATFSFACSIHKMGYDVIY
jgi:CD63 antigen